MRIYITNQNIDQQGMPDRRPSFISNFFSLFQSRTQISPQTRTLASNSYQQIVPQEISETTIKANDTALDTIPGRSSSPTEEISLERGLDAQIEEILSERGTWQEDQSIFEKNLSIFYNAKTDTVILITEDSIVNYDTKEKIKRYDKNTHPADTYATYLSLLEKRNAVIEQLGLQATPLSCHKDVLRCMAKITFKKLKPPENGLLFRNAHLTVLFDKRTNKATFIANDKCLDFPSFYQSNMDYPTHAAILDVLETVTKTCDISDQVRADLDRCVTQLFTSPPREGISSVQGFPVVATNGNIWVQVNNSWIDIQTAFIFKEPNFPTQKLSLFSQEVLQVAKDLSANLPVNQCLPLLRAVRVIHDRVGSTTGERFEIMRQDDFTTIRLEDSSSDVFIDYDSGWKTYNLENRIPKWDFFDIIKFISKNNETLLADTQEDSLYLSVEDTSLARPISITPNGQAYIHFNQEVLGDPILTQDSTRTTSLCYNIATNTPCISTSLHDIKAFRAERRGYDILSCLGNQRAQILDSVIYAPPQESHLFESHITMQAQGSNLQNFLAKNTLSPTQKKQIAEWLLQLGSTLEEQGILHRDLHPGNILSYIDESGDVQLKLIRFGSACIEGSRESRELSSNYGYMSPEMAYATINKDETFFSSKEDSWAIGSMLHTLFKGTPLVPAKCNTDRKATQFLATFQEKQEPSNTQSISHVIWSLLRRNPENRISLQEALTRLKEIQG